MDGKPNIKPTTSPTDYRGSKPMDSPKKKKKKNQTPIQSKLLNQKPQISKSVHQKSLKLKQT